MQLPLQGFLGSTYLKSTDNPRLSLKPPPEIHFITFTPAESFTL
ncbi:hypothetical protein VDG1235_455 [Verrucomicrobiia bacterium DG1235]|nr:hypothetical protein VDG1235_455 [Verrucomicrobiae bacterium DG1235]